MQRWVDKELMPGATAAVVSPEGTWAAAVGVDGQGKKLEPASGLALGQVTQTFVAAEAMLLAEQGKLDLDAPASTLVPVPQLANGATTRHLLSHRAAVPEPKGDPYAAVFTAPDAAWSAEQFLKPVPESTAPPGKTFAENPANYVLAGLVVEKVSGRSAADAVEADLWTPLGLQRLAYQDAQQLPEPIAAPGEDEDLPDGQSGRPYLPFRSFASAIAASHGVAGDAASVARWGYDLYGGQILKPASVAQLIDFDHPDGRRYGMATIDFTSRNWDQYSIDGYGMRAATPGYRSVLAVYPDHHLSVAILTPSAVDVLPYVRFIVNAGSLLT
ncbi:MAG: serine hydrolase domain-containing protein [Ornithinibacter sp.]